MKNIKQILITAIALLAVTNAMAEAWGQHYAKCYIGTKRYRAHTRISAIIDDAYRQCCNPGWNCYLSCSGCGYGCYPVTAWAHLVTGLDKGCSSATKNSSLNGNYYLNGVSGLRRGTAYSKHEYKKAVNNTWVANHLTSAGACDRYMPDTAILSSSRPGFAKALTESKVYLSDGYAHIDSITGMLLVKDSTYYTSVFKVYVVEARFEPDNEDPEEESGCLDLDNYHIIQEGTITLDGWGIKKTGIFYNMNDVVSTTQDSDSGSLRKVNLNNITQVLSYSIMEYDTNLVSIITFADSYYDYEAEQSSNKTELAQSEQENVTPKDVDANKFEFKVVSISKDEQLVELNTNTSELVKLELYDAKGASIMNISEGVLYPDTKYVFSINTTQLSSGLYFLNYRSASRQESLKVVVNK